MSTAVASPPTDCSSSNFSSNAVAYSDRTSYFCVDCVGPGVGGIVLHKRGCSRRELVLSNLVRLALRFLGRVTMPNWYPHIVFVVSQDW